MRVQDMRVAMFMGVVCLLATSCVLADTVQISNGDFELQSGAAFAVTNWCESSLATSGATQYDDWLYKDSSTGYLGANTTEVFGMSSARGWIYQQIGTYASGQQITLSGNAILAKPSGESFRDFSVELWTGGAAASAADTVELGSIGATMVASQTFTGSGLGIVDKAGAQVVAWTTSALTPTGAVGAPLWLRIAAGSVNGETFLDNITVATSTVPEPTSGVVCVLGIAGLLAYAWRKRKQS